LRLVDPRGRSISITEYDTCADLPVFCAEVVDEDGEVVEYVDKILGHTALTEMMLRRGWKEAA
jgi:hypothetical protein